MLLGIFVFMVVGPVVTGTIQSAERPVVAQPPRIAESFRLSKGDDYPAEALRNGEEGKVRLSLHISDLGNVTACRILESSGSVSLDGASCKLAKQLNFMPARDMSGRAVEAEYLHKINWVMPRN